MTDEEQTVARRKAIEYCAICPNMCRFDCPVARAERTESATPAGKVRLVYMLAAGMLDATPETAKYLYRCADCRGCEPWCPFPEVKVADIMADARAAAVAAGRAPAAVGALMAALGRHGHPFAHQVPRRLTSGDALGPAADRPAAWADAPEHPAPVLFLPGCTATALRPATSRAMAAVLDAAGVNWRLLPESLCCGAPARAAGDLTREAAMAARLADAINGCGATTVVTACPGCAEALSLRYRDIGVAVAPRVLHFAAFAAELVAAGRLALKPSGISSAVYHDPCIMARRLDLIGAPRTVIGAVPGLLLREPPGSGRETHCCGGGGMLGEVWPEAAAAVARERLRELAGAEAIITTCPMCEFVFSQAQADSERVAPILDLAELLQASLIGGGQDA